MLTIGTLHVPSVLLSLCVWSCLYYLLRWLDPSRKAEWHCRIVTAVHATFITSLSAWAIFVHGPSPFTDAGGPNTSLQVKVTTICLGYFLFDFSWCIYFQTEGPPMLLHHSLSIIGLTWTLCAGKYGTEMMATVCGSEATNPLLQLRWFLKETGHYNTVLGEVVDLMFMASFFTLRIIFGSILIYCYFQQPTDFWGRFGGTCIYLIGWMFWINIFQYAVYKYSKKFGWARIVVTPAQDGTTTDATATGGENRGNDQNAQITSGCQQVQKRQQDSSNVSKNCLDCSLTESEAFSSKVLSNGIHHRSNGIHDRQGALGNTVGAAGVESADKKKL